MSRIRLFLLDGKVAFDAYLADVEHTKKLSKEKIAPFLEWVKKSQVYQEKYTEQKWIELWKTFGFKSPEELNGAGRFCASLIVDGAEIEQSELESDLKNLGFEQEKIGLIRGKLESIWAEIDDWLVGSRLEAIPWLSSVRWRVDLRHASSNYLKKPEVVVILRFGTSDGRETEFLCMELNKNRLSWLESVIGKIKREFLKAEENLNQKA